MPKRRPAASSTRIPSGTVSLPMPSPGMTAIRCVFMSLLPMPSPVDCRSLACAAPAYRCANGIGRPRRPPSARAGRGRVALERRTLERVGIGADRRARWPCKGWTIAHNQTGQFRRPSRAAARTPAWSPTGPYAFVSASAVPRIDRFSRSGCAMGWNTPIHWMAAGALALVLNAEVAP